MWNFLINTAHAQAIDLGVSYGASTGLTAADPRIVIANIVRIALGFLGVVAVLLILYAGYTWMTAGGEQEKVDRAKNILRNAIIGLIIITLSFAITSYIMGRLEEAAGGGTGFVDNGGGGAGGGGLGGSSATGFRPLGLQPSGTLQKRDVTASVTFSDAPTADAANIRANVLLEKISAGVRTATDYDPLVDHDTIRLVPKTACPAPNADRFCLDANADYALTLKSGLRNADGTGSVNCGFTGACVSNFHTGDAVRTEPPKTTITYPTDGMSLRAGGIVLLQSLVTDPDGVSHVDYLSNGSFLGSDGSFSSLGGGNWSSKLSWDTNGIVPVKDFTLTAQGTNIDGDTGSSTPVRVTFRPDHCFNGAKDTDETAIDCGGLECGACTSAACTSNAQCSTGQCVSGTCVESPTITDVQLRDGKVGNLVTISGLHFGSAPGRVVFMGDPADATDDTDGDLGRCQNGWRDTSVVVAVPQGAKSGPIKIVTAGGKEDTTNNLPGAVIPNFTVNDVARPGICAVNPTAVSPKDALTLSGVAFGSVQGASRVTFNAAADDCASTGGPSFDAGAVGSWSDISAQPKVPNLAIGASGAKSLVTVTVGGQVSNPACIQLLAPDAGTLPHLDFLSPTNGAVGTYLTLAGSNFGADGKVKFAKAGQTAYGETTFPQQCAAQHWTSTNAVVKVPAQFTVPSGTALAQGEYAVSLVRADGSESNVATFTVNTNPLAPGVCRIDPDNGPVGTGVTLYGERFGNVASSDIAGLLSAHPDAVQFTAARSVTAIGSWNDGAVTTSAPAGSSTGPVTLRTFGAGGTLASNGVNFRLQDCRAAAAGTDACGAGSSCCADGACRPTGACASATSAGGFAWQFSTGPISISPTVVENATCQATGANTVMPSPSPFRGATAVCTDLGAITMRFSLPMDPTTAVASNVTLETCGTGDRLGACAAAPAPVVGLFDDGTDKNNLLMLSGVNYAANTWYRVTLKSAAVGGFRSLGAVGRAAQSLDGDADGKGGGNYVTTFKTGSTPCVVSGVDVRPGHGKIEASSDREIFNAFPLDDRCIALTCGGRNVTWSSSDIAKATVSPAGGVGACQTSVEPKAETAPGPDIQIRANIDDKADSADLTIDYANPQVVDYFPHDCTDACPNALPSVRFNTPMKESGAGGLSSSVRLSRCRNESCLAYDGDVTISLPYDKATNTLSLQYAGLLAPNTYYRVTVDGGARSTSEAPLTGLNDNGNAFSWIFRTRADGNPCTVQRVTVSPPVTTLHFIGEVAPIKASPFSVPDTCSATGETLTDSSFNWSWASSQNPSSPEAFTLRPDAARPSIAALDTNPVLPAGCTAQCLMSGSLPAGSPVCGNGKVERSEACDTPGQNGCTARCLKAGNSNVGAGAGQCGNGAIDASKGESCDAGAKNGASGSGCSANCLLTGSTNGASACGNGSVGLGEECDDGNNAPGDGCSSSCLFEGSEQNAAVCGNGVLEAGESCDYTTSGGVATGLLVQFRSVPLGAGDVRDPQSPGFACTSRCLLSGNARAGTSANQCGNGIIEPAQGESCDAGANNGKPGFGCSATCLKTGSNPQLHAFCGDAFVQTMPASIGGAQNGGGEECDAASSDAKIDPQQYLTAEAQCDSRNSCSGAVTASVDAVHGSGSVSVECSCRQDSDCTAFDGSLACGAGACCFKRPTAPTLSPSGSNQCRNVGVTVDFPSAMNVDSLLGNILVYEQKAGCSVPAFALGADSRSWIAKAADATGAFVRKLLGKEAFAANCAPVKGTFTHALVAPVGAAPHTHTTFAPEQPYAAGVTYVIAIRGGGSGVRTANGVGYPGTTAAQQTFATGNDICQLDSVEVTPPSELITTSSDVSRFAAKYTSNHGSSPAEIVPTSGYAWTSTWSVTSDPKDILTTVTKTDRTIDVKAQAGKNGSAQVIAVANITENTVAPAVDPVGTKKSGKADVTVMLCEHPWPERKSDGTWAPYVDPETHFKMFYCRDAANGGSTLPELFAAPTQAKTTFGQGIARFCAAAKADGEPSQPKACTTDAQCGGASGSCQAKDLFFRFSDPHLRDAIGVRVFANPERLSPSAWYADQKFSGSLSSVQVDGYEASKDANTTYVAVTDKYGDPTLVPYVYVLGFNEGATPETTAIYDQLLAHLTFNANLSTSQVTNVCRTPGNAAPILDASGQVYACSADLDCFKAIASPAAGTYCDAPKDKLRRDTKRWQDLRAIADALQSIRDNAGEFPKIESGSFIKGMTTSKWPSWSTLLGAAGNVVDPINAFLACDKYGSSCAVTGKQCATTADCDQTKADDTCQPKFDVDTCFSRKTDLMLCPAGSRIYRYSAIGGTDYQLSAEFEFTGVTWAPSCALETSEFSCGLRPDCRWTGSSCQERITTTASCNGLFNATPLRCNGNGNSCAGDTDCAGGQLCLPSGSAVFGNAVAPRCGNGIVEGSEECEPGMGRTNSCPAGGAVAQTCDNSCHWTSTQACPGLATCGNGAVEAGESCDDGSQNGGYGACRSGVAGTGCARRCINTTPRSGFNASADIGVACTSNAQCGTTRVCTDRMQFCGDGIKNGTEACDDGPDNGTYGHCAWDCSGVGARCGDNTVNGSEDCDGRQAAQPGVCQPKGTSVADGAAIAENPNTKYLGCAKDADCPSGQACNLCGVSSPDKLPQTRSQSCNAPGTIDPNTSQDISCRFNGWSACKPSGACGNGTVEGTEQCDAGSANSATGACLPNCKKNTCGDGSVLKGTEQCDTGASNGVACAAPYGGTCSYCKNNCTIETLSGAFCGDTTKTVAVQSPPEMCDPGRITKWCSKTYTDLLHPFSAATPDGPKACGTNDDCAAGVCKAFPVATLGPRNASCSVKGQASQKCVPDASNACSTTGGASCCDDSACKCPPGYLYDAKQFKCVFTPPAPAPDFLNKSCHSSADCDGATQYCDGGEGECVGYNSRCTPDAYSNVAAAPASPLYHNGACVGCSNSCTVTGGKSANYCGDGAVQPNFGEQCEEVGDAFATGPNGTKTYYGCKNDCTYDTSPTTSGYCGDGKIDAIPALGVTEACDGTNLGANAGKTCAQMGWGNEGTIACGNSCKLYGGGCSDGELSPGDVRIKIIWQASTAPDLDTHVALPNGASAKNVGYAAVNGSVTSDPHVWWSWDDQDATRGSNIAPFTGVHGLEIMTVNWRGDGKFWPSSASDPYKLYVYNYKNTNTFSGARAIVCTYKLGLDKNADCSRTYIAPADAGNYWHVTDMWGTDQSVPNFVEPASKTGKVGSCSSPTMSTGGCPAIGI